LYIGHTDDLESRVRTHNEGCGGAYTAHRKPVRLVYSEEFGTLEEAINRERQVKRGSGVKKHALVAQDLSALNQLSRCRQRTKH
jgi:predicted GIY-YIG superfamily endonuclease